MKIAIGSDHVGYELKGKVIAHLKEKGIEVKDFGTNSTERTDYPIYGEAVANAVASKEFDKGILICGTGVGISLAANKVKGAYAALLTDAYSAERARLSNDANIACMGAFTTGSKERELFTQIFLTNEFVPGCGSQPKVDAFRKYDMERK